MEKILAFLAATVERFCFFGAWQWLKRGVRFFLGTDEQLVRLDSQGLRKLLNGLQRRNRVVVFDAGDVAAKKAGAVLNIGLAEVFGFADFPQPLPDQHGLH